MGVPKRSSAAPRIERSEREMHSCPSCSSVLVQPIGWHEHGDRTWNVELRCPECGWRGEDGYSAKELERYDEELDRGARKLIQDLRSLTRANMHEEADRFAIGLASDSILPEDF
jgi:predicted RNA-binding Zn-ribbon protein involved in translation (DUF1610 family)